MDPRTIVGAVDQVSEYLSLLTSNRQPGFVLRYGLNRWAQLTSTSINFVSRTFHIFWIRSPPTIIYFLEASRRPLFLFRSRSTKDLIRHGLKDARHNILPPIHEILHRLLEISVISPKRTLEDTKKRASLVSPNRNPFYRASLYLAVDKLVNPMSGGCRISPGMLDIHHHLRQYAALTIKSIYIEGISRQSRPKNLVNFIYKNLGVVL